MFNSLLRIDEIDLLENKLYRKNPPSKVFFYLYILLLDNSLIMILQGPKKTSFIKIPKYQILMLKPWKKHVNFVFHDGVITQLDPDILECEVKWALESITTNKASGGDGIPVELFEILKDDAVKVLHSICQ